MVADHAIKGMKNFVTGGNRKDAHLKNVNLGRDFEIDAFADLRMISRHDSCPKCGEQIQFGRGIEVGHVFKLGTKYSEALKAVFLDARGNEKPIFMGCYGIGVGRTLAAAIEQNYDKEGPIFPIPISPFEVTILPLQMHEPAVLETAERIYAELMAYGVDVLFDERDERPGIKFNDADLVGIPLQVIVGLRGIQTDEIEIKFRADSKRINVPIANATAIILEKVKALYDSLE
jgi:prolyl-tRNA synthetase